MNFKLTNELFLFEFLHKTFQNKQMTNIHSKNNLICIPAINCALISTLVIKRKS